MKNKEIEHIIIGRLAFFPPGAISAYLSQDNSIQKSELRIQYVAEDVIKGLHPSGREIPGKPVLSKYLYVEEVALYLKQDKETINKWFREGKLRAKGKKHRTKLIAIQDFKDFIENRRVPRVPDANQQQVSENGSGQCILEVPMTIPLNHEIQTKLSASLARLINQAIEERILETAGFKEHAFRNRFFMGRNQKGYARIEEKRIPNQPGPGI